MSVLSASVPAFASDSLTGPARVCTTRLATVIVYVDHAARLIDRLRGLVGVISGRQPGPDIEELADTLPGDPSHGPAEELPVIPGELRHGG